MFSFLFFLFSFLCFWTFRARKALGAVSARLYQRDMVRRQLTTQTPEKSSTSCRRRLVCDWRRHSGSLCMHALALFLHSSLALFFGTLFHHLLDQLLLCTLSGKSCRNISESLLLGQDRPVGFPNKTATTTMQWHTQTGCFISVNSVSPVDVVSFEYSKLALQRTHCQRIPILNSSRTSA